MEDKTKVILELPKEAAEKLIKRFEDKDPILLELFELYGFELVDIKEHQDESSNQ